MRAIHWGIIGCGNVNEVKSGPAFNKAENSKLLSVMRRNAEKAKEFAEKHQIPQWSANASELIENDAIDAIYISTPPKFHLNYAIEALQNGKMVYVEKPMVLNTSEAEKLKEEVTTSKGKLVVAHYRRMLPMFLKIKELVHSGLIGDVSAIELKFSQSADLDLIAKSDENWRTNPEISGGGLFYDIAPHQIDFMYHVFGTPLKYNGTADFQNDVNVPNTKINGEILFEKEVKFEGSWDFDCQKGTETDSCIISGSTGTIAFSFFGSEFKVSTEEEEIFSFKHPEHVQLPMIQKTVDFFLGKTSNPCTVEDGLAVQKIMDVFTKNIKQHELD